MRTEHSLAEIASFLHTLPGRTYLSGGILASFFRSTPRASGIAEFTLTEVNRIPIIMWLEQRGSPITGQDYPRGGGECPARDAASAKVIVQESTPLSPLGCDFVFDDELSRQAQSRVLSLNVGGTSIAAFDPELFVLSRFLLLNHQPGRFLDEDDLIDIAKRERFVDWAFVLNSMETMNIPAPSVIEHFPTELRRALQHLRRA